MSVDTMFMCVIQIVVKQQILTYIAREDPLA